MRKTDYPPLLLDLFDHLQQQLIGQGIKPEEADSIAASSVEHISDHWKGALIYMPNKSKLQNNERDKLILRKFTGNNYKELRVEFGLSEVRIRQIIKKMQCKPVN